MDWFEAITGFAEGSYAETHARLTTEGDQLVNVKTGRRYGMGQLDVIALATNSLAVLRRQYSNANPLSLNLSLPASGYGASFRRGTIESGY